MRKAESGTTYSKTDIIRRLNHNEPGFERIKNILINVNRSITIVIKDVAYPNITEAVKVCKMHFNTIKECLENPSNKNFQYYDYELHGIYFIIQQKSWTR